MQKNRKENCMSLYSKLAENKTLVELIENYRERKKREK